MAMDTSAMDACALFQMGFEPESVGRALVQALGDASKAFSILSRERRLSDVAPSDAPAPAIEPLSEEEQLELAIRMSLDGVNQDTTPIAKAAAEIAKAQGDEQRPPSNPLWMPPRYLPAEGVDALRVHGGRTLSLVEDVEVRDGGYCWQRGKAFLDTGNQHMTIIDRRFAAHHAIYRDTPAGAFGGGSSPAERWTTLHGVVPGASSRAPVVTIALKLRGEDFVIEAAVSDMGGGHDLLLGVDVLGRLFASGFRIGNGSM